MTITVSGKATQRGDLLYHNGMQLWGYVGDPGIIEIEGPSGQKTKQAFTNGGIIAGKKRLSWHTPLDFEIASKDISKYQAMLDKLKEVLGD